MKQRVIIIHDKQSLEYANLFQNLIIKNQNKIDSLKNLHVVIWTDEHYLNNKPTLDSASALVFIGTGKKLAKERSGMDEIFNDFGMHVFIASWRMALYVDDNKLSYEDAQKLREYALPILKDFPEIKIPGELSKKEKVALSVGAGVGAATIPSAVVATSAPPLVAMATSAVMIPATAVVAATMAVAAPVTAAVGATALTLGFKKKYEDFSQQKVLLDARYKLLMEEACQKHITKLVEALQ